MTSAADILENHEYAYRLKVSDGGAMIVGRDGVLWSLTQKYFKQISPELVENYQDWKPMDREKNEPFFKLVEGVKAGESVLRIHGRTVEVQSPIIDSHFEVVDSPRVDISETGLKAAGQVAEALGIAISCYTGRDQSKADAALKELLWVAKNVAWETKSNRHQFQSKWNPPNAQAPRTPPITSGTEPDRGQNSLDTESDGSESDQDGRPR